MRFVDSNRTQAAAVVIVFLAALSVAATAQADSVGAVGTGGNNGTAAGGGTGGAGGPNGDASGSAGSGGNGGNQAGVFGNGGQIGSGSFYGSAGESIAGQNRGGEGGGPISGGGGGASTTNTSTGGGGGGAGGSGISITTTYTNGVGNNLIGGDGALGGNGFGNDGGGGGGGGGGGNGATLSGTAIINQGNIKGGDGGAGGTSGAGLNSTPAGNGGGGGGGFGIYVTSPAAVITNTGSITGGNSNINPNSDRQRRGGGAGIYGSGLTIDNTGGSITGGFAGGTGGLACGDVVSQAIAQRCAVQFTGGVNQASAAGTYSGGIYVSGGSFQPGLNTAAVGATMNIAGPLVFANGTTYSIRITPGAADNVMATSATLTGATVNVLAGQGTYATRSYVILNAARGGTTFAGVTSNLAFLMPTLTYDGNFVSLNIQAGTTVAGTNSIDYRVAAITGNQFNFATGLTYGGILAGGNNPILTAFNQLTVPQAQTAFDSLTGEGIAAAQNAAFTASRLFTGSISDQILLFGGAPNSVIVPTAPAIAPLAYSAVRALPTPIRVRDPILSRPLYSWRAWGSGYGASQTISANPVLGNAQQSIGIGGGSVGVDYTWAPGMLTGVALGGSDGSFNVGARQTSGSTTGGHAALYTLAEFGPIYAASVNSVSVFGNRTTRTVGGFGGLNSEILRGNFTSTEFRTRVEFGYRFGLTPGVTLTPFYAVEAAKLRSDGFTETPLAGLGLFALNVRGQTASSVPMFFGARLTGDLDLGNGMRLRPSIQAAYVPEFAPVRNQVAGLVNLPGAVFLTDGARPSRSSVQVKTGAELAVLDNIAISANFDGEFSNRSNTYAGKGAIKVRW